MASFLRVAAAHRLAVMPAMAAAALASLSDRLSLQGEQQHTSFCEAAPDQMKKLKETAPSKEEGTGDLNFDHHQQEVPREKKAGFQADATGYFYDTIPNSQLFRPRVKWPMWDENWDEREPKELGDATLDRRRKRYLRKHGVTRHIILVRHGQYDETHKEDEKKKLTKLGREQAHETGKRIAAMLKGVQDDPKSSCNIKVVRVSTMSRAKETADIIASHLPEVERSDPDPLLDEGGPSHHIPPVGKVRPETIQKVAHGHPRIEKAFFKYFHRADEIEMPDNSYFLDDQRKAGESDSASSSVHLPATPTEKHEYEIIVCHANVIRYFFCRALQLPPEAWLRLCTFNCSLTYLTIRPTGSVSCRMLGDIGHLKPELVTFSGHHGFNW